MSLSYGFCLGSDATEYTSSDFCDAFQNISGDGVVNQGKRFSVSTNGFALNVGTGFAFADGHYLINNEPVQLRVKTPDKNNDRTDALVVCVDYTQRKAYLEILSGVNEEEITANPSSLRNDDTYSIVLYFIRVRRGATYIDTSDIVDARSGKELCGTVYQLSALTDGTLRVYNYFQFAFDEEVEKLNDYVENIASATDAATDALEQKIINLGTSNTIGTLETARTRPLPVGEWLLCDGSKIQRGYWELSEMVNGHLPDISKPGDRYSTWIYAGERDFNPIVFVPLGASRLITKDGNVFTV